MIAYNILIEMHFKLQILSIGGKISKCSFLKLLTNLDLTYGIHLHLQV